MTDRRAPIPLMPHIINTEKAGPNTPAEATHEVADRFVDKMQAAMSKRYGENTQEYIQAAVPPGMRQFVSPVRDLEEEEIDPRELMYKQVVTDDDEIDEIIFG